MSNAVRVDFDIDPGGGVLFRTEYSAVWMGPFYASDLTFPDLVARMGEYGIARSRAETYLHSIRYADPGRRDRR